MLSLICFFAGGILGWAAARGGPSVQRSWPVVLRIQILATSATLSLVAVWRLTSIGELLGPLGLAAGLWVMFFCAEATRGRRSAGTGALEAWAVSPNSGFWVVPAATAFAGATGAMIAVLANVITSAWSAVCVHLMRRDAPVRQRRATSWVDQSPILASFAGLILLAIHSAPEWSSDVLIVAAPLLAFSGAALFTGSMLHPHNVGVVRTEHALRRWTWLTGVRVAYYLALVGVAALASSTALAVVAVLSGLSAPSFQPVQQAVLYGYRSEVVMTAIRWGWLLVPAGLGLALLVR